MTQPEKLLNPACRKCLQQESFTSQLNFGEMIDVFNSSSQILPRDVGPLLEIGNKTELHNKEFISELDVLGTKEGNLCLKPKCPVS